MTFSLTLLCTQCQVIINFHVTHFAEGNSLPDPPDFLFALRTAELGQRSVTCTVTAAENYHVCLTDQID